MTSQTGFVDHVALTLTHQAGEPTQTLFAAMLHFAHIAGLGAQTTHGFGTIQLRDTGTAGGSQRGRLSIQRAQRTARITRTDHLR